ncbi:tetratricopeptide repeat protein [Streptomyces gobiensis]|uniref:tetratricopeptide repeat protein n=1 Tax=Streptomyces gobiensis TaxID=2875706 RepID=UPI001E429F27|nr:tetratricopeptide repeat protein [Streptomyces gobiensis]UGY91569.1 tetratricopeptide repeat protein [Streptomyces gobiensis]
MASSPSASAGSGRQPNVAFRRLRGRLSPGEFAAAVRKSARDIGEQVSCDARYIGRVEAGEIRCPNYAYERVFLHMFPGYTLIDMGFAPREAVRGRAARKRGAYGGDEAPWETPMRGAPARDAHDRTETRIQPDEESDVLRRAFMTGGPAAIATTSLGMTLGARPASAAPGRAGEAEASAVEEAVRQIRLLDDRHGADGLYPRAGNSLRAAYELLDVGAQRQSVTDRLHTGAGELAISVGWLAHDSGRLADARSHYAEALATSRVSGDPGLEAHAFCNAAFLARDSDRPREAVRAAQAGQQAAKQVASARLQSLLALREAGGWSGLGDRSGCEEALGRAQTLFARGPSDADPEWMTFFGEAELAGLEAQCWSALGDWDRAARCARRAVAMQPPHFVRNTALFTAELAGDLAGQGEPEEAAVQGNRALDLLDTVRSSRIRGMLIAAGQRLAPYRREAAVRVFLKRL